jgi:hypothetical protein
MADKRNDVMKVLTIVKYKPVEQKGGKYRSASPSLRWF